MPEHDDSVWRLIKTAPRDGTPVRTGVRSEWVKAFEFIPLCTAITSRFIDGKWCADFGDSWAPITPQPTHWMELSDE